MYSFGLQAYAIRAAYGAVGTIIVQLFGSTNVEIAGTRISGDMDADAVSTLYELNEGALDGDARGAMLYVSEAVDLLMIGQHDGTKDTTGLTDVPNRIEAGWHALGQLATGQFSVAMGGVGSSSAGKSTLLEAAFYSSTVDVVVELMDSSGRSIETFGPWTVDESMTITTLFANDLETIPDNATWARCRVASEGTLYVNSGADLSDPAEFTAGGEPTANTPEYYVSGDVFTIGRYPN